MNQKTKIVATLGPASESTQVLEELLENGVNVFRFNLKHNDYEWHSELAKRVRSIADEKDINIAVLADLQGPELRTGNYPNGEEKMEFEFDELVTFGKPNDLGYKNIPFDHLHLVKNLQPQGEIYIDDGKIELQVEEVFDEYITATVKGGGVLGTRKSISIPKADIQVPTLNEKDRADIKFAIEQNFDYIALSFVRDGGDIATLRKFIHDNNGKQSIVAKIETLKAIENLESVIEESDSIMVARGDLGIEVPIERVPKIQKQMIDMCRQKSKPVIVATQMLLSMVNNALPSRAEVADIANSVFDKTDALMLSEESATGNYPVTAVRTMGKIARYNESLKPDLELKNINSSYEEVIIEASVEFSKERPTQDDQVKGYVVFTESGKSARVLSRFRSPLPVFAFSRHADTVNRLALSYGVKAFDLKLDTDPVNNTRAAIKALKDRRMVFEGDRLIVIFGNNVGVPESNNTLSIVEV